MKRSKAVFLLAPLLLTSCSKTEYATNDQCQTAESISPDQCIRKRTAGGGYVFVHPGSFYTGRSSIPSVRYGFVPGASRGGFGVAGRAIAAAGAHGSSGG